MHHSMLNAIPLFRHLTPAQVGSIGAHAAFKAVEKGHVILQEGEVADSFYVIMSGQVKVYLTDANDAGREVILKTLKEGDFFGEIPILDQAPRSASVAAMQNCHLQVLSYRAFQRALEASPDISRRVMGELATRVRDADRKIGRLALMDISSRVSRTLTELAILSNGRRVVGSPFTQKDLASMVGASREMVNRTLKDLQDSGYIDVQRKSITILDEAHFAEI
jgi:CRP/FNR family transcriptional regulator, cyclic AMP receptor protein